MNQPPTPDTYPDLFAAYSALWVILCLYLAMLGRRLSALERRLKEHEHADE